MFISMQANPSSDLLARTSHNLSHVGPHILIQGTERTLSRLCIIMAEGSDRVRTGSGALSDLMDVLARTHVDRPWAGIITWQPKEHNDSTWRRNQAELFYEQKSHQRHRRQQLAPGAGAAFSVDHQDLCKGLFARSLTLPPDSAPHYHISSSGIRVHHLQTWQEVVKTS